MVKYFLKLFKSLKIQGGANNFSLVVVTVTENCLILSSLCLSIRDVFICFVIINNIIDIFLIKKKHLSSPLLLEMCCSLWAFDGDEKKLFCNKGYVMRSPPPQFCTKSS